MNWKGVFPAVTTKFHADGSLDMNLFFKNLDSQLAAGVHGIILGGTLGESSVLSQEEKITLTRETVNYVNGRVPVVLNIAEGATQDALFWAKKAEELGAKVFQYDWSSTANFAKKLNWALRNVPFETTWLIRLDADEYFLDENGFITIEIR